MIGTQVDYAKHCNVSKQAVFKWVREGKIEKRPDGKIDFAAADFARNGLSGRLLRPDNKQTFDTSNDDETVFCLGSPSLTDARTERETYAARMAKLRFEQETGLLVPIADVEEAMVTGARAIRLGLGQLVQIAEQLDAAARNGGVDSVRGVLREEVRKLEAVIADNLQKLSNEAE